MVLPNQNLRQIGQEVYELYSNIQINTKTNRDYYFIFKNRRLNELFIKMIKCEHLKGVIAKNEKLILLLSVAFTFDLDREYQFNSKQIVKI